MHPKSPKSFEDIATACANIVTWTADSSLADYEADVFLRSAVERNFEIIGEALLRLERTDPATANRISDYRKIIGFRNRLAHGYNDIDNQQVWEIAREFLPVLRSEVEALLNEVEP
jgi:uncharacterized protein with HEPN domain